MKQTVQIIGGQFRGKKIQFPAIEALRPTPNRVRETLFNWLMHDIRGARCLDAFAGSGALGFEAFSRGATVTLLEHSKEAFQALQKTAQSFHSKSIHVINKDALFFLKETHEIFNIVFLDPPFSMQLLPECMTLLATGSVLAQGGLLYIESPIEMVVDEVCWQRIKLKKAGNVVYGLYKKNTFS